MVSTGQMMGYVMAILLPLIAVLIPFYILWKQSSKVERGMLGAIGYGIIFLAGNYLQFLRTPCTYENAGCFECDRWKCGCGCVC